MEKETEAANDSDASAAETLMKFEPAALTPEAPVDLPPTDDKTVTPENTFEKLADTVTNPDASVFDKQVTMLEPLSEPEDTANPDVAEDEIAPENTLENGTDNDEGIDAVKL